MSLETAMPNVTRLPAERLLVTCRGMEGMTADLAVFEHNTATDRATLDYPHRPAVGVRYAQVEGESVGEEDRHVGAEVGTGHRHSQTP